MDYLILLNCVFSLLLRLDFLTLESVLCWWLIIESELVTSSFVGHRLELLETFFWNTIHLESLLRTEVSEPEFEKGQKIVSFFGDHPDVEFILEVEQDLLTQGAPHYVLQVRNRHLFTDVLVAHQVYVVR